MGKKLNFLLILSMALLVSGCSQKFEPTESTIFITSKGLVQSAVIESFDKSYYDFDELIANEELDCIHICTPHYLHTDMAVKALAAGINVLTEKPCSVSFKEVEKLCKAQKESALKMLEMATQMRLKLVGEEGHEFYVAYRALAEGSFYHG